MSEALLVSPVPVSGELHSFEAIIPPHVVLLLDFNLCLLVSSVVAKYILNVVIYTWLHIRNIFHLLFDSARDCAFTEPSFVPLSDTQAPTSNC